MYTTPKSYLDLIKLCMVQIDEKREELQSNIMRLSNGLTKLQQANTQVANLNISLTELKPLLEVQTKEVNEALIQVEQDSKIARVQEINVEQEASIVNQQAAEIKVIMDEA